MYLSSSNTLRTYGTSPPASIFLTLFIFVVGRLLIAVHGAFIRRKYFMKARQAQLCSFEYGNVYVERCIKDWVTFNGGCIERWQRRAGYA